ncbi:MAG TPA: UDP-N-acetylmuramoyl-tripeptide--D-alanyl-D-alanine ligase [Candidatus Limnocylindrales bacterium]|nr:UDP-N-acetylmuramoyl-tripeptide--D-alanyl-D-alanine ligase [Candidatus Limnocylindrales bacterium]
MSDAPSPVHSAAGEPALDGPTIAHATGGRLLLEGHRPVRGACVDSRRLRPGELFVALPGEQTDGHRFLEPAVRAGAAALLVSRDLEEDRLSELRAMAAEAGVSVIRVEDGLRALQALAAEWRSRFSPLVVGVTGSVAKTSTKEAVAETLTERWRVLRSEGNENNEIGLPLTLLRLGPEHEVAVLEMGMYVPGEIALLARLARPRVGVVTAVRATHLSRAGSLDAIERGKGELVEALPLDGTAVLNADDARVRRMAARTRARSLGYGFDAGADVRAEAVESLGEAGMRFVLHLPGGERLPATTPSLGRHSVHNALAAAAVGLAVGLDAPTIVAGIARGARAPHRSTLLPAGEWRILDDSYNAAPDSMAAALDLLASLPGRHVAVLGEMRELGEMAAEAHREVGRRAAATTDLLVVVGAEAAGIAEGARAESGPPLGVLEVPDREAALALLAERLRPGDTVLVKASRGVQLDLLVEQLAALGSGSGAPRA